MRRTTPLVRFSMLLVPCLAGSAFLLTGAMGAAPAPVVAHPAKPEAVAPALMPDLVITAFGLSSWGGCTPGQPVFTFSIGVKNQGRASWTGVEPALLVRDLHPGVLDDWSTGIGIDPPIPPGQTRNIQVSINYYAGNPGHMTAGQPHPFQATVNPNHVLKESNFMNNAGPGPAVWNGVKVIMVGAPEACAKGKPGAPR